MADRDYKVFIVEGKAREPLIIDNISKVFFAHANLKIITLPVGQNIYMLWKKLEKDDFDTDIIEVLREESNEVAKQLEGLERDDFSEIYLLFDYDGHQNNLGKEIDVNVIEQMLESFDNETENGKLYISYPMVEALRDFEAGKCGNDEFCFVSINEIGDYKTRSAEHSFYPQFKEYNFLIWKEVIDIFGMRISCLMSENNVIDYERYVEEITPFEIYKREEAEIKNQRVFVLSAFPEFLLDYFGIKLWKSCVKHSINYKASENCMYQ